MTLLQDARRPLAPITPSAPSQRQQLLFLWLSHPNPTADCIAWSLFDGSGAEQRVTGDQEDPPYRSVLAAMQDGWRVIQVAQQDAPALGLEHRTSFLPFWFALERLVETDHV